MVQTYICGFHPETKLLNKGCMGLWEVSTSVMWLPWYTHLICLYVSVLQLFDGNQDSNSIVRNDMPVPESVITINIMPISWNKNFAIRFELYGCLAGEIENIVSSFEDSFRFHGISIMYSICNL